MENSHNGSPADYTPSQDVYKIAQRRYQEQEIQVDFSTQTFENRSNSTSPFPPNYTMEIERQGDKDEFRYLTTDQKIESLTKFQLNAEQLSSLRQALQKLSL